MLARPTLSQRQRRERARLSTTELEWHGARLGDGDGVYHLEGPLFLPSPTIRAQLTRPARREASTPPRPLSLVRRWLETLVPSRRAIAQGKTGGLDLPAVLDAATQRA